MAISSATEELMADHRLIERMLAVLLAAAARVDRGLEIPKDLYPGAVDFIRTYADRYHHGKEEDNLFPAMERRGIPRDGGPIGVMLMEHVEGRNYVKNMDEASRRAAQGDKEALRVAARNGRAYADLLAQHIGKEDNILYAMADRALSSADQQQLLGRFNEVYRERLGADKRQHYVALVERLEKELGLK